jgi:hypothetical protein
VEHCVLISVRREVYRVGDRALKLGKSVGAGGGVEDDGVPNARSEVESGRWWRVMEVSQRH